jgi:hypothetical protein
MPFTRDFVFEQATKNTYRYREDYDPANSVEPFGVCIGPLYVQKAALPTKPQRIRVTVEPVEVTT